MQLIYFYSGTPGSGKSLHVAEDIYNYLRRGKKVIANFDVNTSAIPGYTGGFYHIENYDLSPEMLFNYAMSEHEVNARGQMIEKQTLLVIDECQLIFNPRSWNDKGRMEWCSFFTQHRKYGFTVILVSQFDRLVDRQIRSLIEYEYKHRKVNNFKAFGKILGLLSGGSLFCCVIYWYGVKEKVGTQFFRGRRKFYNLYNSYKLFDGSTPVDAGGSGRRTGGSLRTGEGSHHPAGKDKAG